MIAFVGGLLSVSFNVSSLVYNLVKILYEQDPTNFRKCFIAISCLTMLRVKKLFTDNRTVWRCKGHANSRARISVEK